MDLYDTLVATKSSAPPDSDRFTATRRLLVSECRQLRTHRVRGPRRWAVPVAAAAFLLGAGAATWAVTRTDPTTSTTIECGADTYIPVESGNPIADCHAALARQEAVVPPLAGWITPTGLVAVLPVGVTPPTGSTPLPSTFAVNRSILYVGDVLNDEAQPISASCTTSEQARSFARFQLDLADLRNWSVHVRTAQSGTCVGYMGYLDSSSQGVTLVPETVSSATNVEVQLDQRLRAQLTSGPSATCDTSAQAASLVEDDAHALGMAPGDVAVSVAGRIGTSATTCALVTIDPGGSTQAIIWQVPTSS
jgi:hypothetical protein